LFDGKSFAIARLNFRNAVRDFADFVLQVPFLTRETDWDAFKLRMTDDNGVNVAGGDAGAKLLPVCRFKIFFACDKDICRRIQPQKL